MGQIGRSSCAWSDHHGHARRQELRHIDRRLGRVFLSKPARRYLEFANLDAGFQPGGARHRRSAGGTQPELGIECADARCVAEAVDTAGAGGNGPSGASYSGGWHHASGANCANASGSRQAGGRRRARRRRPRQLERGAALSAARRATGRRFPASGCESIRRSGVGQRQRRERGCDRDGRRHPKLGRICRQWQRE